MFARSFWFLVGVLALALAIAGALLPLLPTTVFLLVAVYAFARSSKRLHDWIMGHRHFGRLVRNWQAYGSIDRRSKFFAILAMIAALAVSVLLGFDLWILLVQAGVLAGAALFILTRPDTPEGQ